MEFEAMKSLIQVDEGHMSLALQVQSLMPGIPTHCWNKDCWLVCREIYIYI